jgi:hypothetical protein
MNAQTLLALGELLDYLKIECDSTSPFYPGYAVAIVSAWHQAKVDDPGLSSDEGEPLLDLA